MNTQDEVRLSAAFQGSVLLEEGKLYHIVNRDAPFDNLSSKVIEEGLILIDEMYAGADGYSPSKLHAYWFAYELRVTRPRPLAVDRLLQQRLLPYGMPWKTTEMKENNVHSSIFRMRTGIYLTPVEWEELPLYLGYKQTCSTLGLIISEGGLTDAVHASIRSAFQSRD